MRYEHTNIYQKSYQLVLAVYRAVGNFKREHKFSLGEKLKNICHEILDLVILANFSRNKIPVLELLDRKIEMLRIHLRIASDLKIASIGQIETINVFIEDIGNQIGGWKKWAANHPAPAVSSVLRS